MTTTPKPVSLHLSHTPQPQVKKAKPITPAPAVAVGGAATPANPAFTCKDPVVSDQPSLLVMARDYQFEDSDYELLSSEGVKFKVHAYRLQAASPYFRRIIKESKTAKTLSSMKTNFGYARVIQVLLDIIYTSEPSGCQNIALAYQVIDLATHWQCETVLKILKKDLAIQALINNPDGPCNDQFRLAHRLGDYHLMALMVQRDRDSRYKFTTTMGFADHCDADRYDAHRLYDRPAAGLAGLASIESPMYELGGLSYVEFLRLPPTVVWSLSRSAYLARKDCPDTVDVDVLAQQFETLLNQANSKPASKVPETLPKAPTPLSSALSDERDTLYERTGIRSQNPYDPSGTLAYQG